MEDFSALSDGERAFLQALQWLPNVSGTQMPCASRAASPIDGIPLRVLSLERIIASKRAANRLRHQAVIPALEEALAAIAASDEH